MDARRPIWVWAIIACAAMMPPLLYTWTALAPPAGHAPSRLRTLDSYCYLTPMIHAPQDWFSPYARCGEPLGGASRGYYGMPYHLLYAALGLLCKATGIASWTLLGLANGLGFALLLHAVHRFFQCLHPALANRAFLLAVCGGGLGGIVWLLSHASGLDSHADFAAIFLRFGLYDLTEGARSHLHLLHDRLYYTLPMALCLLGITRWLGSDVRGFYTILLLALGTFLNFRVGPMIAGAGILIFLSKPVMYPCRNWWKRLRAPLLGTGLGIAAAMLYLRTNPFHAESSIALSQESMWFSAFLCASFFLLPPACVALAHVHRHARGWVRSLLGGVFGYWCVFTLLYFGYQLYYGNWPHTIDAAAAIAMSDWSLSGLLLGAWASRRSTPKCEPHPLPPHTAGVALWFLLYGALAYSAWGQGAYLAFAPQRFMATLGIPLALLAAEGLSLIASRTPRVSRAWFATTCIAGLLSMGVTWLGSYGPWGFDSVQRALPWTRFAYVSEADQVLMSRIPEGSVVLTPATDAPLFGDILSQHPGVRVVYGNGSLDFSREDFAAIRTVTTRFYEPVATEQERQAFLRERCITHVYCPDTAPVPAATRDSLRASQLLKPVGICGEGILFEVRHAAEAPTTQ